MLETLRIQNIAIIDSVEIRFTPGLNILSGETGAGKSIIIEAISLLLGSRAKLELIRNGSEEAIVEGVFIISEIPWIKLRLKKAGFSSNSHDLLIKRTIHRAGRHRISINGELATLASLQSLCEGLIDLCGQHEHQSLLKTQTQLELLDRYGGLTDQTKNITLLYNRYRTLKKEQEQLQKAENERTQRTSFLKFQIYEIEQANIQLNEDSQLQQEKQLHQSAETRAQTGEAILEVLESEDQGILNFLKLALQKTRILINLDDRTQPIVDALERAFAEIEDASHSTHRYLATIELDPERLLSIQERLSLISDQKRKYGPQISDILETLKKIKKEFTNLDQTEAKLQLILTELKTLESELIRVGKKISQFRKNCSELLSNTVTQELKDLKMGDAKFLVELSLKEHLEDWNGSGGDSIQFLIQTNQGESTRPIGKIASGGELSRIMLSIRRVIADRGGIGVYLFDEIDAGMGGQTAFEVGKKLKSVAAYNQVICITHLPQVASFADHHLVVRKGSVKKRTTTQIMELSVPQRQEEIARMLGGPVSTRKSLENASELLELAGHSFSSP